MKDIEGFSDGLIDKKISAKLKYEGKGYWTRTSFKNKIELMLLSETIKIDIKRDVDNKFLKRCI